MKVYKGTGGIAPHILNLSTSCREVASITLQLLYSLEKRPSTEWREAWVSPSIGNFEKSDHFLLG
jgi:hypothetical protein